MKSIFESFVRYKKSLKLKYFEIRTECEIQI
jgi:hypothetical protein